MNHHRQYPMIHYCILQCVLLNCWILQQDEVHPDYIDLPIIVRSFVWNGFNNYCGGKVIMPVSIIAQLKVVEYVKVILLKRV